MPEEPEEKKHGLCPLLNKECIKHECAWYFGFRGTDYAHCSITKAAEVLFDKFHRDLTA